MNHLESGLTLNNQLGYALSLLKNIKDEFLSIQKELYNDTKDRKRIDSLDDFCYIIEEVRKVSILESEISLYKKILSNYNFSIYYDVAEIYFSESKEELEAAKSNFTYIEFTAKYTKKGLLYELEYDESDMQYDYEHSILYIFSMLEGHDKKIRDFIEKCINVSKEYYPIIYGKEVDSNFYETKLMQITKTEYDRN